MDTTQTTFHFGGRIPEVLIGGLSLLTTRDFVLFTVGLVVTAVFVESLQRIGRACRRRLVRGSCTAHSPGHGLVPLPRPGEPNSPRYSRIKRPVPDGRTESPPREAGLRASASLPGGGGDGRGPTSGGEGSGGEEMTSLVGSTGGEAEDETRRERALRSLSITLMTDRWQMMQVGYLRKVSRSRRLAIHALQTLLQMLQLALGYVLMLVIMTFNAWFLIFAVGGAGLGYLIFSSDLPALYASYAQEYVTKKMAGERSKQSRSTRNDPWPKKSWKTRLMKDREMETTI